MESPLRNGAVYIALMTAALLCAPASLYSQSLSDTVAQAKIRQHEKQKSSVPLLSSEAQEGYLRVFRYRPSDQMVLPGTGTFDGLPSCESSAVRRKPVFESSKELKDFDMTFYEYKSREETAKAKESTTPTVPYLEGDLVNPFRDKENLQQNFARFFDIRCLPTRVFFRIVDGQRVEEYREGEKAWDDIPSNFRE